MITDVKDLTSFKWATVTALSPLRIKLDGDTAALLLTPDSLIDPAGLLVNDRVRVELTERKVVIHGKSIGSRMTLGRNLIRNAQLRVNQRVAASGASLGVAQYFLDGWASNSATNAVTWTGGESGRVLTIPASKEVYQFIEANDVGAGTYVFGQSGTSLMRIIQGATDTGMVASGTVTLVAGTQVTVLVGAGTLDRPYLMRGSVAPLVFPDITFSSDLWWSQRFYEKSYSYATLTGTATDVGACWGTQNQGAVTTGYLGGCFSYKASKRAIPTVTIWDPAGNVGKCRRHTHGVTGDNNNPITVDTGSSNESVLLVYSSGATSRAGVVIHFLAVSEL